MPANFLEESENEIIRNIHPSEMFIDDSFEVIQFGFEITLIVGKPSSPDLLTQLLNSEKKMIQAVKFGKPTWDMEEALAWLQENQKNFNSINNLKKYAAELKSVKGVEIFSAGTWNGDTYTVADLNEMVKAFDENKDGFRPPLKLGHAEKQTLLQEDGMPAAGWVGSIYVQGNKLIADFIDIPKKIFELIENKAYRKVSSEIFWNIRLGDNLYKKALAAVSLLGSDNPAVSNLSDILANYKTNDYNSLKIYNTDFESKIYNQGDKKMPENKEEILKQEALRKKAEKADQLQEQVAKFTADQEAKDTEIAELKKFKADQEVKLAEADAVAKQAKKEQYIGELKAEKLCTPSMEKYINELLSDKKVYSIDDKETSNEVILKEALKLFKTAQEVNFDEGSLDGEKKNNSEDAIEKKIEAYAVAQKCDYSTAYRAVHSEMQNEENESEEE